MLRPLGLTFLLAAAGFAASFTGPTSVYYLSDSNTMYKVQGLNLLSQWAVSGTPGFDLPMAVSTEIHSTGRSQGTAGARYDLNGTYLGTTYTNPGYAGGGMDVWDGTTDTAHNYTVSTLCNLCGSDSSLIQTDLDWSNSVVLFNIGAGYDSLGVTYDPTNNSLWVSKWNGGTTITDYTLSGTVITQFDAGFAQIGALAYDAADDTLWATNFGSNALFQFNKSGTLLQSGTIAGLNSTTLWSGEMVQSAAQTGVPEPETLPLFGLGMGALALVRRRRRG